MAAWGVFVTLQREGRPRGCYGSFSHSSIDMSTVLRSCLLGALRQDPRVNPVSVEELDSINIIVTVAGQPFPVESPEMVNIHEYGIMVVNREGVKLVFVPAEIRTHEHLQALCGPPPYMAVYAFRSVTVRD